MAIFTAYFDAGGHPDEQSARALTVAGFITVPGDWILVQRRWKSVLSSFGVSALHMKDFAHSRGEFTGWKGDEKKRGEFISALVAILKIFVRNSFACSLDLAEYRRVDAAEHINKLYSPLAMVGCRCIGNVLKWADEWKTPRQNILTVFEDGGKDRGNLSDICRTSFGFRPAFEPKRSTVAFEAADLLAYEYFLLTPRFYQSPDSKLMTTEIRKSMQALHSIPHQMPLTKEDTWVMFGRPHIENGFKDLLEYLRKSGKWPPANPE